METFIVDNIVFYDKELAGQAEKEWKKIQLLQERLDESNPANVAVMYRKAVEGNVFQTPVGMAYLLRLRNLLERSGYEKLTEEVKISCGLTQIREKQAEPAEEELQKRDAVWKNRLDAQKQKEAVLQQKCQRLKGVIIVLAVLVAALFVIGMTGKNPTILNYRSKIINQYSAWEQNLQEREALIREKEAELGIKE